MEKEINTYSHPTHRHYLREECEKMVVAREERWEWVQNSNNMKDLNNLYQKLKRMKASRPKEFGIFSEERGSCWNCNNTIGTRVCDLGDGEHVYCKSCIFTVNDCHTLGLNPSVYKIERLRLIEEIIKRVNGKKEKGIGQNRDERIYRLYLFGRSHAHIGMMYDLTRERVRQIINKMKKYEFKG